MIRSICSCGDTIHKQIQITFTEMSEASNQEGSPITTVYTVCRRAPTRTYALIDVMHKHGLWTPDRHVDEFVSYVQSQTNIDLPSDETIQKRLESLQNKHQDDPEQTDLN